MVARLRCVCLWGRHERRVRRHPVTTLCYLSRSCKWDIWGRLWGCSGSASILQPDSLPPAQGVCAGCTHSRMHRLSGRPVADTVASVFQVAGLCGGGGLDVSGSARARMTVRSLSAASVSSCQRCLLVPLLSWLSSLLTRSARRCVIL